MITLLLGSVGSPELRTQAVEKLCDLDHRHNLDTQTPVTEDKVLRPAANDGTTRSCGEGGVRLRTVMGLCYGGIKSAFASILLPWISS